MRFLLYNIRYGTGGNRPLFPWSGYLKNTTANLGKITRFIKPLNPDVVGLVEVDAGSYRSGKINQAHLMAEELGHYHIYRSKYGDDFLGKYLPCVCMQGNAFLSRNTIHNEKFHYFDRGIKRLVIELELENLTIFLVHLSIRYRIRQHQLGDLYSLVKDTKKPHIVAGDFNALWGDREIHLFLAATGLANANAAGMPSFPSWKPRRQLDFVLHSHDVKITNFEIPEVTYSDHLPIVCDFDVP